MMGFGEYHHWPYGRVLKGKPNYVAYIAMGSGRRNEMQVRFQELLQDKKGCWNYQRNLAENEDPDTLGEPKTMPERRMLEKKRIDKHWQESFLYRLLRGDPDSLEEQGRNNEQRRMKEKDRTNEQSLLGGIVNIQERINEENGRTFLQSEKNSYS